MSSPHSHVHRPDDPGSGEHGPNGHRPKDYGLRQPESAPAKPPAPDPCGHPPTYQGRPLPRPEEEVVDQGLQFDLTTLLSRRIALGAFGVGAGSLVLAACSGDDPAPADSASSSGSSSSSTTSSSSSPSATSSSADLEEIPEETAGPYPANGSNGPDILEQSGIVRRDITGSFGESLGVAAGVALDLTMTVLDLSNGGAPLVGAAVYLWQCDADQLYSMYSPGAEYENYLRGVQVADERGELTFTSIFPACYSGRWPHVHFEVYPDVEAITDHRNVTATSQGAFPEDVCRSIYDNDARYASSISTFGAISIDSDGIFDADTVDQQMIAVSGERRSGLRGTLTVPVDPGS